MTYQESLRIGEYLAENPRTFESQTGMCEFLTPEGRCHIHPARPTICITWGLTNECKFMKSDPKNRAERIRAVRLEVVRRFVGTDD